MWALVSPYLESLPLLNILLFGLTTNVTRLTKEKKHSFRVPLSLRALWFLVLGGGCAVRRFCVTTSSLFHASHTNTKHEISFLFSLLREPECCAFIFASKRARQLQTNEVDHVTMPSFPHIPSLLGTLGNWHGPTV